MDVGADGVGPESLTRRGNGLAEQKAPAAVSDVEDHAALLRLGEIGTELAVAVEHRHAAEERMRVDVTRPQPPGDQLLERPLRHELAEIHHDGDACLLSGLDGAIHWRPFGPAVMGRLHTDDEARELPGASRR